MKPTPQMLQNALPSWWGPAVRGAVAFRNRGPAWVPLALRKIPLWLLAELAKFKARQLINSGEGPRSGGGEATSGAGAKRKEGVQPPGDSTSAMEVSA